jgi:hypothetical protein
VAIGRRQRSRLGAVGVSLGETASSFDGGTPGLSDSFASTFGWVDKLGMAAALGLRRVIRQDLVGAEAYSLFALRRRRGGSGGMEETPTCDYWASLLWRRLMGATVLQVNYTDVVSGVRATIRAHRCFKSELAVGCGMCAALLLRGLQNCLR